MDAATVALVLTALGAGGILLELTKRIGGAVTGRGRRRRDEVDRAWRRADREASRRRRMEEYASRLVRVLTAAPCVDLEQIPPWPAYDSADPDTDTISKEKK